jgi:excisionase family DNA binding protein
VRVVYEPDDFFTTFTVVNVAAKFGVRERVVREWIASGKLQAKKIGRAYFITKASVKEFLVMDGEKSSSSDKYKEERMYITDEMIKDVVCGPDTEESDRFKEILDVRVVSIPRSKEDRLNELICLGVCEECADKMFDLWVVRKEDFIVSGKQ